MNRTEENCSKAEKEENVPICVPRKYLSLKPTFSKLFLTILLIYSFSILKGLGPLRPNAQTPLREKSLLHSGHGLRSHRFFRLSTTR
jgi:hypothetical protein